MTGAETRKTRIILHAGFHKTGSSSIQETFSRLKMDGVEYLKWGGGPNHSGPFQFAFFKDKSRIYGVGKGPQAIEVAVQRGNSFRADLVAGLENAVCPTILLSGEDFSTASRRDALEEFKAVLDLYASDIRVICYVRPHSEVAASKFQQQLKMGTAAKLIPEFRLAPSVQMLRDVFGKDAVTFVPYDRTTLVGGDVVLDFAQRIGVPISPEDVVRANETLSEEALAAFYCHFLHGKDLLKEGGAVAVQRRLQDVLASYGTTKFRFSASLAKRILEAKAEDVLWIEQNLGIRSVVPSGDGGISSEQDLIACATEHLPMLVAFAEQYQGRAVHFPDGMSEGPERVAFVIDCLKDTLRQQIDAEAADRMARRKQALQAEKAIQRRPVNAGSKVSKEKASQ